MSLETDELNQPNDGDDSGGRHRFGFRHADTGLDEDGANRDVDDQDAADDDLDTEDGVDTGTVYQWSDDADAVGTDAADDQQPTFTPVDGESATTLLAPDNGQVVQGEVVTNEAAPADGDYQSATQSTLDDSGTVPVNDAVPAGQSVPGSTATAAPVAAFDENAPLLGDPVTLKASWQQAAAEFVDDPRAAVAEAADLVEHTAQTLVGALEQRQRQLRGQWENGSANGGNGTTDSGTADTEELRHLMKSYRVLFNQLCAL